MVPSLRGGGGGGVVFLEMNRMKTKVDGLTNSDASASISSAASVSTTETPRQFGSQLHASLGNQSSSQSSAKKAYASNRFASATTGNEKNATTFNDATLRISCNSNSTIQVNENSIGHPSSSNNNINSTSTHLSTIHRTLDRSPSYINVTLTPVFSGENCCKWGFIVARQLTFVQNTFSDIMPNANTEHGHGSTFLYTEEENAKEKEMDSCSDSQSTIDVDGYPAIKEKDELVVSIVQHGSPAHGAGLVEGDICYSVYGQKDPPMSLLFRIMRDSTGFVVKVKRMESSFERGFREKQTEYVSVALVEERISGHNNPEEDLVRPLDGDNDENHVLSAFTDDDLLDKDIALAMARAPQSLTDANGKSRTGQIHVLSAFTDDDLLDKDIALAMARAPQSLTDANGKSRTDQNHVLSAFMNNDSLDNDIDLAMVSAPQSLTDANGKSRTGVDINQVAAKAVQAAGDDSDDDRTRQVTSFNLIHARKKRNSIGQQKTHGSGSDGVCMVEESSYLDETDVQEESVSTNHDLLHYALHVVDEEMTSFDQSDVELATDNQPQGECGSSTSEIDDQMREEPFRNSPTVHAYANTNDAHTNAQLSNYQSALAMSDAHKSQVDAGIQYLSPQEAVIVINDVNSPLQFDTGEENAAADLAIDITETQALATMQSHSVHAHAR
eukprot:scaffold6641_cov270-Chaetoceros_neogracile.AAC.10